MLPPQRKQTEKRSPFKAAPLRTPGQSINDQMDDILWNDFLLWLLMPVVFVVVALREWYRWFTNAPPHPILDSIMAVILIVIAAFKFVVIKRRMEELNLGRKGELVVGQLLEEARKLDYRVFHDIVGRDYNIDHALVGPGGVFSVETKSISKPRRGKTEIHYDGEKVLINGIQPERDPIIQCKAEARELRNLIAEMTGRKYAVQPILVYPGWFVHPCENEKDVWVRNEQQIIATLRSQRPILSTEDISLINHRLGLHIRQPIEHKS
jgi:hypothetical protein